MKQIFSEIFKKAQLMTEVSRITLDFPNFYRKSEYTINVFFAFGKSFSKIFLSLNCLEAYY